ncbi:MAG: hypothetical protein KIS61_30305 [Candidatus Eremiobacteraeota bacterium]|nr:hypothetical protein [Candidatus Eremiobacteraeota bacterium]
MLRISLCFLLLTSLSWAKPNYIDLDYVDEDLVKVLRQVSKHLGYNLYLGNEVKGKVTIQARHVPADGVVALVLKMQERPYSWYQVGNTLVVGSPSKMERFKD